MHSIYSIYTAAIKFYQVIIELILSCYGVAWLSKFCQFYSFLYDSAYHPKIYTLLCSVNKNMPG